MAESEKKELCPRSYRSLVEGMKEADVKVICYNFLIPEIYYPVSVKKRRAKGSDAWKFIEEYVEKDGGKLDGRNFQIKSKEKDSLCCLTIKLDPSYENPERGYKIKIRQRS